MLVAALFAAAALTRARYLMGTVCEVTASPASIEVAFNEAARIEAFLSTWRRDSELSRVNAGAACGDISPACTELVRLLRDVVDQSRQTDGAFNPLVGPVIRAWKIRENGSVPDAATLQQAVARARLDNVTFANDTVTLRPGAEIEEGGFGKGYALDRMLAAIPDADFVINFGGQIAVRGEHVVTIAHPLHRDRPVVTLTLNNESLSTSSGSEKSFTVGGRRFSHLVDPRTGEALPPRGSVSVIDRSALRADILSTALYVMGREAGLRWAHDRNIRAIFISESGEVEETK